MIVTKADKGNATVVTKKEEYIDKMNEILSDTSKFELIENPPKDLIQKEEKNLNKTLLKLQHEYESYTVPGEFDKNKIEYIVKTKRTFDFKT